jgi:hypothetical protein
MVVAADTLGFTTYPAAYLSPQASGKNLLIGANFASAGSGYYDHTALMYVSIIISDFFFGNVIISDFSNSKSTSKSWHREINSELNI